LSGGSTIDWPPNPLRLPPHGNCKPSAFVYPETPHGLDIPMSTPSELLATARRKRELAQRLVQLAPGLSVADDRARVIQHARLLEEEAAKLEAKAAEV
jgi:hypothetical protein